MANKKPLTLISGQLSEIPHDDSLEVSSISLDTTPNISGTTVGRMYWDDTNQTVAIGIVAGGGANDVTLQVGQESYIRVRNNTGSTITNGKLVYISGSVGNRPSVALAKADSHTTSHLVGMATHDIAHESDGFITTLGTVGSLNTNAYTVGDVLYLSASTAGEFTKTAPSTPNNVVSIGVVTVKGGSEGKVLVRVGEPLETNVTMSTVSDSIAPSVSAVRNFVSNNYKPFNGFENRTDSALAMNGANFEISKTGSGFNIWTAGTKYPFTTTQSVAIANDQTLHYVYFNTSGVLSVSTSAWDITSANVPVATVYKDGTTYAIQDERHGHKRCREWHMWAHDTIGTRYESGLTGAFTNTTLSIAQGVIHDEDIDFDTGGTKTACRLWYRNNAGTSMRFENNISTPYKAVAGTLQYDSGTGLVNVATTGGGRYVNNYVYAAAISDYPIQVVVGQAEYSSLAAAQSGALPTIPMSTVEWKLIYRVTYRNIAGTATYIEAADYRTVSTGPAVAAIANSHAALINRDAADSHPQAAITGLTTTDTPTFAGVNADHISEKTTAHGVDVDGVLCKDGGATVGKASLGGLIMLKRGIDGLESSKIGWYKNDDTYFTMFNGSGGGYLDLACGIGGDSVRIGYLSDTTFTPQTVFKKSTGAVIIGADPIGSELLRVGGDVAVAAANSVKTNHIAEVTSAHGVDVDGVLCKDSVVTVGRAIAQLDSNGTGITQYPNIQINNANAAGYAGLYLNDGAKQAGIETLRTDGKLKLVVGGATKAQLFTDGSFVVGTDPGGSELLRVGGDVAVAAANSVKTNHITEVTSAHGVDIDGVLCKDGKIKLQSVANVYDTISPLMIKSIYKQHKSLTTANKNRLTVDTSAWSSTDVGAAPGSYAYVGGVLLPDGRVFCVPRNATQARIYDAAGGYTDVGAAPCAYAYYGGVLLPDGRVFCVPHSATQARIYDAAGSFTDVGAAPGGAAYFGGVLLPDGRVFCVPHSATQARIYDAAGSFTDVGAAPGGGAYVGGVLLPDGRVFCVPHSATQARIYDAAGGYTDVGAAPCAYAYFGGVLLPDGRVFCVPAYATQARIYDAAGGYTDVGAAPCAYAYYGGVLLPDGRVFCVPFNATQARIYDGSGGSTDVGAAPGSYAYIGGVLLPDGRVFCVPFYASQARIYDGAISHASLNFPTPLLLGGTLNKL
jgi:hypothetical protein